MLFRRWVVVLFKQKTAYEMRISDWSSDVCSSDLLGAMTGEDALSWRGYLAALARRRRDFMAFGATASDHGHPTAFTANLPPAEAEVLFARVDRKSGV